MSASHPPVGPPSEPAVAVAVAADEGEAAVRKPAAWKQWLRLLVAAIVIGSIVYVASRSVSLSADLVAAVGRARVWQLVVAGAALVVVMLGNGLVLRELVAHFGVKLDAKTWVGITFVASMLNFVSPISGAGAMRGLYLKRMHGLPFVSFGAIIATSGVFSLTSNAALAVVSLLALGIPAGDQGKVALAVSCGLLLLPLFLTLLPRAKGLSDDDKSFKARVLRVARSWRGVGQDRRLLLRVAVINAVAVVAHGVAFIVAFDIAGFEGSIWVPLTSSAFARTAAVVAITPAGLGVYEAFGAVSAQMIGVDASAAVLGVLIVRVLSTVVSIGGGLCFSPLLVRFRRLNKDP